MLRAFNEYNYAGGSVYSENGVYRGIHFVLVLILNMDSGGYPQCFEQMYLKYQMLSNEIITVSFYS